MTYLIIIILIAFSALFSGLTLGLMSLDVYELARKKDLGDKDAKKIYPIRKKGNLLLTTLLLGNVAVNAILSIFLGTVASGVIAGLVATALIFLFGEIIPQAVIARHALKFGAAMAPVVRIIIWILLPVCLPIAWILDKFLGEELRSIYSKKELMRVIEEHEDSKHSDIDEDEERVLKGALSFSEHIVSNVMTPRTIVMKLKIDDILDDTLIKELYSSGFSRFPVFGEDVDKVVGVLYLRDLLFDKGKKVQNMMKTKFLKTDDTQKLDGIFNMMIRDHKHMCMVHDEFGTFVGVVTLEDILEEIVGHEIIDEDDVIIDTRAEARRRAKKGKTK